MATAQDEMTEAAFQSQVLGNDADLAALCDGVKAAGFATFVSAGGLTGPDGARLDFAAYADGSGAVRAAVRHCVAADCVRAVAEPSGESIRWTDASGDEVPARKVPVPPLLRERTVTGKAPTKLVSALAAAPVVDPASVDLSCRRVIVANQFGALTGLEGASIATAFASDARFSVIVDDHVAPAAIDGYLSTAHAQEVLVVVGQGVRQVPYGKTWHVTPAIEASSGLYGFEAVGADRLQADCLAAPFSGPGVVVLAGAETMGDGTDGSLFAPDGVEYQLDIIDGKVVAGFQRSAPPAVLFEATREFLRQLGAGGTAAEARDKANALLDGWGFDARLRLNDHADTAFRLLPPDAQFWGARTPTSIDLFLKMRVASTCVAEEATVSPWCKGLAVDGPIFQGDRDFQGTEGENLKAHVVGRLGELRKGAHFHFAYKGDIGTGYVGVTFYGNAEVQSVAEKDDGTHVTFDGTAQALPYTNEAGKTCTLPDTQLTSRASDPSELVVHY